MLYVYILSLLIEFLLLLPFAWSTRYILAGLIISTVSFSSVGLLVENVNWLGISIVCLAIFRIFNLLRIAEQRMNDIYLKHAVRRTSAWLFVYHGLLGVFWMVNQSSMVKGRATGVYLSVIALLSIGILLITFRNIAKTRHPAVSEYYPDKDLPTVTVAVPARDETSGLEDMIRTIIASNYPKLEVIVLDDCSADKTPDIIRQFAQDGVRFMPGDEPKPRWLAKNFAYEKLADEANGELILFAGVDVRFGPEAIRALVTTMLNRQKAMVSVLPRRLTGDAKDAFIQPMRYWWELTLPRRLFNRPAVLSTCWLIKRDILESLGGFAAVSNSIIPEGYFARELVKNDGYSFIRADDELDIQTRKSPGEQIETAVRMRYPQFKRRPEWVLLAAFLHFSFLMVPMAIALSAFFVEVNLVHLLSILSSIVLIIIHVSIVQISNPANTLVALVNLPLAAISELVLTIASMYQYEFSVVEWKGRNICPPIMHILPHLPKLDD